MIEGEKADLVKLAAIIDALFPNVEIEDRAKVLGDLAGRAGVQKTWYACGRSRQHGRRGRFYRRS